ncbi:MAG: antibiotic biosynthesis monooxygenase, partial [Verrucomicrobia bacterium]|nr:antibiotic biosynthesis monooxygenase [Verrucomicrobiota bacterium]
MSEIFMLAKLKAKAGSESSLEKELINLVKATHSETGCLLYDLHRDEKDPSLFVIIEPFLSKQDLDAHYVSSHFSKHFSVISSLIEKDPEITELSSLKVGVKEKL